MSCPVPLQVLSSFSSSLSSSTVYLFILSTLFTGHVTGAPKGYDYDIYDDGLYRGDPYSPNIIKVDKVVDYYSKPQYAFGYEVDDYYNQLSHGRWEIRDGDVTQGQYRVLLPDGRIQIVSYIADKFGYRPTVEYIGKGAHPPPPPVYANINPVPVAVPGFPLVAAAAAPAPVTILSPTAAAPLAVQPTALPIVAATGATATPLPKVKASVGVRAAALAPAAFPSAEEYNPVKIKLNSLPVNGPLPIVDPYGVGYGYGLDPAFSASTTSANKVSRKRALLYDRTLFRKDLEKRATIIRKVKRRVQKNNANA